MNTVCFQSCPVSARGYRLHCKSARNHPTSESAAKMINKHTDRVKMPGDSPGMVHGMVLNQTA